MKRPTVLIGSANRVLSDVLSQNLRERAFDVEQVAWMSSTAEPPQASHLDADLILNDPDCARGLVLKLTAQLRGIARTVPIVVLGYGWPDGARMDRLRPAGFVRKPFPVEALLRVVPHFAPDAVVATHVV